MNPTMRRPNPKSMMQTLPNPLARALQQPSSPPPATSQVTASPAMAGISDLPQIQRRKQYLADQLMQGAQTQPESIEEGIADLGSTAINGLFLRRANEEESQAKGQANQALAKALQGGGDVSGLFSSGAFEGLEPGQQALASALLQKQMAGAEKAQRFEVGGNLVDENGNVVYQGTPELKARPTRQIGRNGQIVDQEMQPDGTWMDIGARPQFAPDKPSDRVTWRTVTDPVTGVAYQESSTGERKDAAGVAGGPDPEAEGKLRKEFDALPEVRSFNTIAPIYNSMVESAGRNTRASDLNLVYGLAKIMDPGSVVREGEQVMVVNTASLPDWLKGQIEAVNGGSALQGGTRTAIMEEAKSRVSQIKAQVDQRRTQYQGLAQQYQFDPNRIVPSPFELPSFNQPPAGTPSQSADEIIRRLLPGGARGGGPL